MPKRVFENELINKQLDLIEKAEEAMKNKDYSLKGNDASMLQTFKGRVLMTALFAYRKTFDNFTSNEAMKEREKDSGDLAKLIVAETNEDFDVKKIEMDHLLFAKYSDVNNAFIRTYVKTGFREILGYFVDKFGENRFLSDFKSQLSFSFELEDELGLKKPLEEEKENKDEINVEEKNLEVNNVQIDEILMNQAADDPDRGKIIKGFRSDKEIEDLEYMVSNTKKLLKQNGDVRQIQLQYMNLQSELHDANKCKSAAEIDSRKMDEIFGNLVPGDLAFANKFRETAARLAKGDSIFELQKKPNEIDLLDQYNRSAQFLAEVCGTKYPGMQFHVNEDEYGPRMIYNEYGNKTLEDMNNRIADRAKMTAYIRGINGPKTCKKAFDRALNDILKGRLTLTGLPTPATRNLDFLGKAISCVNELFKENGFDISRYNVTLSDLRTIAENKIDGVLVAAELENQFNRKGLGIHTENDLTDGERRLIQRYNNSEEVDVRDMGNFISARNKLQGLRGTGINQEAMYEALTSYSRLKNIHNQRGFFFSIFHPNQNSAEEAAINNMERELINRFGMDRGRLSAISIDYNNRNTDALNLFEVKGTDNVMYDSIMYEARNQVEAQNNIFARGADQIIEDQNLQNDLVVDLGDHVERNVDDLINQPQMEQNQPEAQEEQEIEGMEVPKN